MVFCVWKYFFANFEGAFFKETSPKRQIFMMLCLKYVMPQMWNKISDVRIEKGGIAMAKSMFSVTNKAV